MDGGVLGPEPRDLAGEGLVPLEQGAARSRRAWGVKPWVAGYRLDKAVELKFVEKLGGGLYRVTDVVPAL